MNEMDCASQPRIIRWLVFLKRRILIPSLFSMNSEILESPFLENPRTFIHFCSSVKPVTRLIQPQCLSKTRSRRSSARHGRVVLLDSEQESEPGLFVRFEGYVVTDESSEMFLWPNGMRAYLQRIQ